MSVDTRTPRTPGPSGRRPGEDPGGSPRGFFDDEPVLSTVKVPSDPAQVIVNHASFRVQLAASTARATSASASRTASRGAARGGAFEDTEQFPAVTAGAAPGQGPAAGSERGAHARRRAPVVWSGHTEPGESGATKLLQAVRAGTQEVPETPGATTQTLPRVEEGDARAAGPATVVGPPRGPRPPETAPEPLLRGVRPARGAFDDEPGALADGSGTGTGPGGDEGAYELRDQEYRIGGGAAADVARRQAYYPGRRMNLGVVLLPLRVFLGFISIYAGMGKLCDPVYFDGGERGSMVTWLRKLEPWTIASPLRDFALEHPVGSGLTVAFLQVIVGVLTMCGLWQRLAAGIGALLSAALLMTVSWSTVPAYDAPDIIYLAAWSPLLIAGAPVYSVDGKLATDAWRKLGPRADLWDLRRRVLRRGAVVATIVVGSALLIGSTLGGAVRSSQTATVPEPGHPPTNQLPGSPLPKGPGQRTAGGQATQGPGATGSPGAPGEGRDKRSASPSASASTGQQQPGETAGPRQPGQQETVQAPQQQTAPPAQQSAPDAQPSAGGTTGTQSGSSAAGGTTGGSGSGRSSTSSSGGGDSGGGGALGGLLGGGG
ncbi:DoxX family protein [Streptomyces sp. NPDC054796]